MSNLNVLAENHKGSSFGEIYEILASEAVTSDRTRDSLTPNSHSINTIKEIQLKQYENIMDGFLEDGVMFEKLSEHREKVTKTSLTIRDSFYNPVSGAGTPIDPGFYNSANVPISLTPDEATSKRYKRYKNT